MKNSREFEIAWMGLKPGVHEYSYELNDHFFAEHEAPVDMHDWKVGIKLRFDRHASFFRLHFDVGGTVTLPCDRCGDPFPLSLWDEFDLLVKLSGEEDVHPEDDDADVTFISRTESVINVADWLYEFSLLSLPLQRIHPNNADGTPGCNPQALRLLGELSEPEELPSGENNPWKGLDALKEKNLNEDSEKQEPL
jgi:uncharacterized metal-binding protein YceD (DUF177 family)